MVYTLSLIHIYGGETLTALLARRDALIERISGLNDFLQEASNTAARATRSEIVIRSTVDVSALQKQADELSKQLRELDVRIQAVSYKHLFVQGHYITKKTL